MRRQKGFTLVELLVVIAIIAILAGAVLIAINPQSLMRKSRDATRLSDIDTMVRAMNLALAESELTLTDTPATVGVSSGSRVVTGGGYVYYTAVIGKVGLAKYLPVLPIDPLNTGVNVYSFASNADAFEFNAVLESPENETKMTADGGDNPERYEAGTSLTIIN